MPKVLCQPVFVISFAIVLTFVLIGAAFPTVFEASANASLTWVATYFGWFYLFSIFGIVVVLVYLAFSKYGDVHIGPPDSEPEFSFFSWIAMLLAAGFGIGLVFYGVAEPMTHYLHPPYGMIEGETREAARLAIQYSFFNWGISQWAGFSIVGLIIGIYQFRKGEPGLVSIVLAPITKNIPGSSRVGDALDIFAVVATVLGVATSLGLGVLQVNGGLNYLFGIPEGFTWQTTILAVMFVAYMISAATGLERGIKILSSINLALALALMAYVIITGPTTTILKTIVEGLGDYLQNFFTMSLRTGAFEQSDWANRWTIFYWAWVIAWSPFVGTFVARVSRGRTITEYVLGVLVIPPLFACIWMGVFGGASLHMELAGDTGLAAAVDDNITTALFKLFAFLPLATLLSILGMILIFIFLITSADSASYIVAQMTNRSAEEPQIAQRLIAGALIAAIALTLIATGGLEGLQAGVVLAALPFSLILYAMVWMLFRELSATRQAALEDLYEKYDETPVGATAEEARQLGEE